MSPKVLKEYSNQALINPTMGVGFVYHGQDMAAQTAAIQAIMAEYLPSLDTGSIEVDTALPEFIAKLEAAGINDVIEDKQSKFDSWLNK
jgi:putative aldouronate transport system substrate-binding protein